MLPATVYVQADIQSGGRKTSIGRIKTKWDDHGHIRSKNKKTSRRNMKKRDRNLSKRLDKKFELL